jgi:hypothetical protein
MSSISSYISLSYSGGTDSFATTATATFDQAGTGVLLANQTIGTTTEAIALGDLANVGGGLFIKNNDETNYVEVDSANTYDKFPQKILPGRAIFLASQTTTLHARANTAAVSITIGAIAS